MVSRERINLLFQYFASLAQQEVKTAFFINVKTAFFINVKTAFFYKCQDCF
jgi:hypothetical protein